MSGKIPRSGPGPVSSGQSRAPMFPARMDSCTTDPQQELLQTFKEQNHRYCIFQFLMSFYSFLTVGIFQHLIQCDIYSRRSLDLDWLPCLNACPS